jgi:hypothetical protein
MRHFLVLYLVLGLLALLVLDRFLHDLNFAVLSRPARNSVDFLAECPFRVWRFIASLAGFFFITSFFFNLKQCSVLCMSVLQCVHHTSNHLM